MKSFILSTTALAGLASAQNGDHLSGGEDHNVERHQEECDAGVVVDCQVEENWGVGWLPCDMTCGQGHSTRSRDITVEACNGGAVCPPLTQQKICMTQVRCLQPACLRFLTVHRRPSVGLRM
jgi:hypothetical protein